MSLFKDWYIYKDAVPILEAMQKIIASYHDKDIHMIKVGCTLPNLTNICLQESVFAKFYPFTKGDEEFLKKNRQNVVGGPSIVFTRKEVVDEILFENQ